MIDYQDLEDRIASLERTTRNLGIGQELVVGNLHALDKVVANEVVAKKPPFNVKAWGAKGDNSTSDRSAIQQAINAASSDGGGVVYFPPLGTGANDRYKIHEPLYLKNGVSFLGDHAAYSRISAHGSEGSMYSALAYSGDDPQEPSGFFIKNLTLGFEDMYDDSDAICLDFDSPSPNSYLVENVILKNGYYGYYDAGGGFENVFLRVNVSGCKTGIYKHGGGTGTQFYNVYTRGTHDPSWDSRGWDIDGGVGYAIQACAMDNYHSNTNGIAVFSGGRASTINGFVFETCEAETAGNRIITLDTNYDMFISGMSDVTCVVKTDGGDNTRLIFIDKTRVHFSGCNLGAGTTCNGIANGGAGEGYAIDISGAAGAEMSRVTVTASSISNLVQGTETPTVYAFRLSTAVDTIQLTLDNVLEGTILNPNANSVFNHH